MQKHFTYASYVSSFHTVVDVMKHQEALQKELTGTDMENLRAFNKTYFIITTNVFNQLGKRYFRDEDSMQKLDIVFAQYYFDALKRYVTHQNITPSWKILFDNCKQNTSYQFIYMALGVNAHVNNDLGYSLFAVITDEQFKKDFDAVNKIIDESISEVVKELIETSSLVTLGQNYALGIYKWMLTAVIKKWRKNAWDNYLLLKSNGDTEIIAQNAQRIAKELLTIRTLPQLYKVYNLM